MNLSERLRELIEVVTPPTRRFVALEEETGLKAETWRTWWNRGGKASADMIQAAGKTWPEYAFWLVTGTEDFFSGHTSPRIRKSPHVQLRERSAAKAVFLKMIEYAEWRDGGSLDAKINGKVEQADDVFEYFRAEINELTTLRNAQEEALESIEANEPTKRIDSPY
ncbi:hypothetical protein INH39_08450 [Massilia violaceinigra]|uniref:DNA-binding protein n=1 Tax=Massilia violaceinigra TaxID=2045208 RepID=A0ABY4AA63_9BURK|nr:MULTISPECIES: hypothetical protein [Massilia]MCY0915289.1 hypothetical protein [Massilia sp. H27-R4]UOD31698.1 hypothetical protein INH39_08450 [Massilia violaceinigra]